MFASLLLAAIVPAAPVPLDVGPPIACTVKRVVRPPQNVTINGRVEWVRTDDGYSADVILTNRTKAAFEFQYMYSLGDRLHVKVVNSEGKTLTHPAAHTAMQSIVLPERICKLKAGESTKVPIHLLQDVAPRHRPVARGKYRVTVIVDSGNVHSESAPIEIEVK